MAALVPGGVIWYNTAGMKRKDGAAVERSFAIFDMDGTLVDSMGFWQALGREYLTSKGVTEGMEEVLDRMKPMTMTESGELFIQAFGLSGTPESVAGEISELMAAHYRLDIPMKPGVRDYLEEQRRLGVRMCVASATAEDLLELCLRRLGLREYFEFLLSCETVGQGKTRPEVYLAAAERLGAPVEAVTVYEDARYAVRTAKRAGFHVVAVYDRNSAPYWTELCRTADGVVLSWTQGVQPPQGPEERKE